MFKNLTTKQVSIYITAFITIFAAVFMVSYVFFFSGKSSFIFLAIYFSVFAIICFYSTNYFLQRFVFRKIKLIYKIISNKKFSDNEDFVVEGNFDKVNTQVARWAADTEKEISDLKNLEDYRRNFVGNLSHELKTPIFAIQGYLLTLLDGGLYDEKINKKYVRKAASNAERLQNIVDDLEIIHQLESGNVVLMMSTFDIKALTKEVFDDLNFLAKKKSVKLLFKEGASASTFVLADKERIRSVLNNLIVNSIKYNDEEGTTHVSFYNLDEKILVEISDNGIGIQEKHLKHLFDRFYRVDSSRSREQGGSGLGLAIVKHIVESHGQNINVRSTENIGSSFGFTLQKANQ
jgi:two-component system phosphate regulon sensor histidine kinase PhoR